MRKDEFIKAANRYNRRAVAIFAIPMLLALGFSLGYSPFQKSYNQYLSSRIHNPPEVLKYLPVAIPFLIALAAMIPLTRRNDRDLGVGCPHCLKPMAHFKAIVVASKNCPYCGTKVLED